MASGAHRSARSAPPGWMVARAHRAAVAASLTAAGGALVALIGWLADIPLLRRWVSDGPSMKFNTAVAVLAVAAGTALFASERGPPALVKGFGWVGVVVALGSVLEYVLGRNIIAELIVSDPGDAATHQPGRLSPNATLALLLLGTAVVLSRAHPGRSQALAAGGGLVGLAGVLGYASGVQQLYGIPEATGIAVPTSALLLALGPGLALASAERGWMSRLLESGPGAVLLRQMLPWAILLPALLALLRVGGEHLGLFGTGVGTWLTGLVSVVMISGALLVSARRLDLLGGDLWLRSRLLDAVNASVIATDVRGRIIYWNAGAERLYGWTSEEVAGRSVLELSVGPEDKALGAEILTEIQRCGAWEGVFRTLHKDGTVFPALVHNMLFRDAAGEPQGIIGVSVDISDRVNAERELREARDFLSAVTDSMGEGLLTLDTNGHITYANLAAVHMLRWTEEQLVGSPVHDIILPQGEGNPPSALCGGRPGVLPLHVQDESFVRADGALLPVSFMVSPLRAGPNTGDRVVVFSDDSERRKEFVRFQRELEALGWVGRIRSALEEDDLVLYAQPIVDAATGAVCQHELLVRMRGGDGTIIAPGEFLPIAECYGMITHIDRWVIERGINLACAGHPVEINLSAASLDDRLLADWIEERIRRSRVDPALLTFEVTETALLADEEMGHIFASRLADRGCGLALDDFGTGYGGFTYLKRLHVDVLKIDIEFVRDLTENMASRHVVTAVVSLARGFGLQTVAEGVEDQATLDAVRDLGVDMVQGFHTGRPAPVAEVFAVTPEARR